MIRTNFLIFATILLSACAPLKTKKPGEENIFGQPYGGVPYHLPQSRMTVQLDAIKDDSLNISDLKVTTTPIQVSDPKNVHYLVKSRSLLHDSTHTISVKNGLLQSISTTDEGRTGEIIQSLLNSAINLYRARSGFINLPPETTAQSTSDEPFLNTDEEPSRAEILKAFNMFEGERFAFSTKINDSNPQKVDVPGTRQLLSIHAETTIEKSVEGGDKDGGKGKDKGDSKCGQICQFKRGDSGVLVRTLVPAQLRKSSWMLQTRQKRKLSQTKLKPAPQRVLTQILSRRCRLS